MHSWWIPDLGGKVQAVPGYVSWTWFKISKPGSYTGQCSFICGRGHATMKAEVTAVPPAQFRSWLQTLEKNLKAARRGRCRTYGALLKDRRRGGREPVRG